VIIIKDDNFIPLCKPRISGLSTTRNSKHIWMNCASIAIIALSTLGSSIAFAGSGDGPRSFPLLPKNLNLVTVYALAQTGNQLLAPGEMIPDADIDAYIGILQYTRTFSMMNHLGAAFVAVPYANIKGSVPVGGATGTKSASDTGFGGIILGGVIGLVGSPALVGQEFAAYDPGFQLGLVGKAFLPTGSYDPDKTISVGSNRLAGQLVLPITYSLGSSMIDPTLTTFEILPSITIFEDNTDPSGSANTTGQDPLFTLESHITRNLTKTVWASVGGIYNYGGETSTDGVWNNDRRESIGVGASVSFAVSSSISIKVSYGESVWRNDNGMDGKLFRFVTTYAF
jgi:hypothetical protein